MTSGMKTIIYPVTDIAQAKTLYGAAPGRGAGDGRVLLRPVQRRRAGGGPGSRTGASRG